MRKKKQAKRLSKQQKEEMIEKIKQGESLRKIAQDLKISYLTAYNYYHKVKNSDDKKGIDEIFEKLESIEKKIEDIKNDLNQIKEGSHELKKVDINQDINQGELSKNLDDYITLKEASKILGVSERMILVYLKRGFLKGVWRKDLGLFGKGRMIFKKSVEELLRVKKERGES